MPLVASHVNLFHVQCMIRAQLSLQYHNILHQINQTNFVLVMSWTWLSLMEMFNKGYNPIHRVCTTGKHLAF